MPRGRRKKIVVPTGDTQAQFELGDTAEDIERRRREREEREERERREQQERDRETMERERGKRARKEERTECELIRILIPDMASSLRRSRNKQLRRAQNVRHG